MIIRRPEVEVGDRFANHDLLGRDKLAEQLSQVINGHSEPLVIALDDGWGSGKSHFLKLWVGEHKQKHPKTTIIYFDAFKHDYLDDSLTSLVIRLEEELNKNNSYEEKTAQLTESISALSRNWQSLLLSIGKAILSAYMGRTADMLTEPLEKIAGELNKSPKSIWDNEKDRVMAMDKFTEALKDLAQKGPLVFIVDELDRCRPDYPLKLLEIIKHFFWVDKVHFILGVNSIALENSVKAKYGQDFDASVYLKKFVNIRMRFLPIYEENSNHSLAFEYFDAFCDKRIKKGDSTEKADAILDAIQKLLQLPSIAQKLSLRDIDQLFTRLSLFPKDQYFKESKKMQGFLAFAAILETIDKNYFDELISNADANNVIDEKITDLFSTISTQSATISDVQHFGHIGYYNFIKECCIFVGGVSSNANFNTILKEIPMHEDEGISVDNESNRRWMKNYLQDTLKTYFTTFSIS